MTGAEFVGALGFAAVTGLATFVAPCAYPLLPGYVGYYLSNHENPGVRGAAVRGSAAAGGAFAVLALVGAVVFAFGQAFVSWIIVLEPVIGAGFVVLGTLMLVGRAPTVHVSLPERRTSVVGFALFGAVYAVAAAGCVVPVFGAVVKRALSGPPVEGMAILGTYAGSVALPFVGVMVLAGVGVDSWRNFSKYAGSAQRVAAILVILAGLWQMYKSIFEFGAI